MSKRCFDIARKVMVEGRVYVVLWRRHVREGINVLAGYRVEELLISPERLWWKGFLDYFFAISVYLGRDGSIQQCSARSTAQLSSFGEHLTTPYHSMDETIDC